MKIQYTKWQNSFNLTRVIGVVLAAGLTTTSLSAQPASAQTRTYSLWCNSATPLNSTPEPDTQPVELGVRFSTKMDGVITDIRFYRLAPNDSGYAVHLWNNQGVLLGLGIAIEGQAPTPGWQTVQIYPPVPVKAGETYTASYYVSNGMYAADLNFFGNNVFGNGPLSVVPNDDGGGAGVFAYTTTDRGFAGTYPKESYKGTNYWVDVVFQPTIL